jgi:hypothetical protein
MIRFPAPQGLPRRFPRTQPLLALALLCLAETGCADSGSPPPASHPPHFNRAYNWYGDAPLSPNACWRSNPPKPNCT